MPRQLAAPQPNPALLPLEHKLYPLIVAKGNERKSEGAGGDDNSPGGKAKLAAPENNADTSSGSSRPKIQAKQPEGEWRGVRLCFDTRELYMHH
jgi:hypothetical protein